MRCIFCLEDRPGTDEHVFPLAIGGSLVFDRVCAGCNSYLGSKIDTAISDNFLIRNHRAKLGLAGNSGKVPALHETLLGVGKLSDETRVHVGFDDATGKLVLKAIPSISDVVLENGTKARQLSVDVSDVDKIPRIIKRERALHGLPELPPEELALEAKKWLESGWNVVVEQPSVLMTMELDFSLLPRAMLKIIYELAFLWLGETYLEDPVAVQLRAAIRNDNDDAMAQIRGDSGGFGGSECFQLWEPDERHHLAYAAVVENQIIVAIRIFNIHVAAVQVTEDAAKYLVGENGRDRLRFLAMDATTSISHETSMMEENGRIAMVACACRQMPPVPDPL